MNGSKLAADKQLDGIDPKSAVLTGDISINEDEGLAKGKTYTISSSTARRVGREDDADHEVALA